MITISPGQALLIELDGLINNTAVNNKEKIEKLKKLYWLGVGSSEEDQKLMSHCKYSKNNRPAQYNISQDPHIIQNDSTRRYFETVLAKETLVKTISLLNKDQLTQLDKILNNLLNNKILNDQDYPGTHVPLQEGIYAVLTGTLDKHATLRQKNNAPTKDQIKIIKQLFDVKNELYALYEPKDLCELLQINEPHTTPYAEANKHSVDTPYPIENILNSRGKVTSKQVSFIKEINQNIKRAIKKDIIIETMHEDSNTHNGCWLFEMQMKLFCITDSIVNGFCSSLSNISCSNNNDYLTPEALSEVIANKEITYQQLSGLANINNKLINAIVEYHEYSDSIKRINSDEIQNLFNCKLSHDDEKKQFCDKIRTLIQVAFLAGKIVDFDKGNLIPTLGNLYEDSNGPFMAKRGRKEREGIQIDDILNSGSRQLGIMTSTMPPILTAKTTAPTIRPTDRRTFDLNSDRTKKFFNHLTLPFINSISGVMLCLMKCLQYLHEQAEFHFTADDSQNSLQSEYFIKCFTSAMLYLNGGHSFYEFLETFSALDQVQDQIKKPCYFIKNTAHFNLESLFFRGKENQTILDSALKQTIAYNKILLGKKATNQELQDLNSHRVTKLSGGLFNIMGKNSQIIAAVNEKNAENNPKLTYAI